MSEKIHHGDRITVMEGDESVRLGYEVWDTELLSRFGEQFSGTFYKRLSA